MNVLVPIETTARELLYKVYLGLEMASRGVTVFVGTKHMIGALIASERRYIYFDKGFHPGHSEALYAQIRERDGRIVNLDEEGAVDYPDGSTLRHRYAPALFAASSRVFLWGSAQQEWVRPLVRDPRQVVVTGHPRFQLLKPGFRTLYAPDAEAIVRRFGPFVLVNTNMGFGNNLRGDASVASSYRSRFPFIDRLIAFDKRKVATMVTLARAIAQRTGRAVVIRPHPEEDADTYRSACAGISNLHVRHEGSVIPWILAADAMVHPDCTTAIEAVMLDRSAISLLPADFDPELVTHLPCQLSRRAETADEAIDMMAPGSRGGSPPQSEAAAALEAYFAFSRDSAGLIVDEVMNVVRGGRSTTGGLSIGGQMSVWRRTARSRWGRRRASDSLLANKLRGFTLDEMQRAAARVAELRPGLRSVCVNQVAAGLFRFRNRVRRAA